MAREGEEGGEGEGEEGETRITYRFPRFIERRSKDRKSEMVLIRSCR
jgi:hypothetical protein